VFGGIGLIAYLPTRFGRKQLVVSGLLSLALGFLGFFFLKILGEQGVIQTPGTSSFWIVASLFPILLGPVLLGAALSGAMRNRR
jgi:hypothetical protein